MDRNAFYKLSIKLNSMDFDEEDKQALRDEYLEHSIHIALERADDKEDWETSNYRLSKYRRELMQHIDVTSKVFKWNCIEKQRINIIRIKQS